MKTLFKSNQSETITTWISKIHLINFRLARPCLNENGQRKINCWAHAYKVCFCYNQQNLEW